MGPEIAVAASLASAGLGAGSAIMEGRGEAAAQRFAAERDRKAAAFGRLRAEQTDVQLREELNRTLASIDTVRVAAGADPFSPTALAIKEEEARIGDRERMIRVGSIREQADEDERSATYRRMVGRAAIRSSYLRAGAGLAKAGAAGAAR